MSGYATSSPGCPTARPGRLRPGGRRSCGVGCGGRAVAAVRASLHSPGAGRDAARARSRRPVGRPDRRSRYGSVDLLPEEIDDAVRPLTIMLDLVGEDGAELRGAGYLKPGQVEQLAQATGITEWWIGKANREDLTPPVAALPAGRRPYQRQAGLVALLVAAAGRPSYPFTEGAEVLQTGWSLGDGPITEYAAYEAAGPTLGTLTVVDLTRPPPICVVISGRSQPDSSRRRACSHRRLFVEGEAVELLDCHRYTVRPGPQLPCWLDSGHRRAERCCRDQRQPTPPRSLDAAAQSSSMWPTVGASGGARKHLLELCRRQGREQILGGGGPRGPAARHGRRASRCRT